jgi:hypothetical protein
MNYGYVPTEHDEEIAAVLKDMVAKLPEDERGQRPYIEVNETYPGVRIRRITHYTDEQRESIIKKADAIYEVVLRRHGASV